MQDFHLWSEKQWALDKKKESLEAGWHFRDTDETTTSVGRYAKEQV